MKYLVYANYTKILHSSVLQESIKCLGVKSWFLKKGKDKIKVHLYSATTAASAALSPQQKISVVTKKPAVSVSGRHVCRGIEFQTVGLEMLALWVWCGFLDGEGVGVLGGGRQTVKYSAIFFQAYYELNWPGRHYKVSLMVFVLCIICPLCNLKHYSTPLYFALY